MLASLLASLASGETLQAVRRARRAAIAYLLAGAAGLCGIAFLVGALYIFCSERYGSLATATGFGVGFIAIALLILVVHRLTAQSRARRVAEQRSASHACAQPRRAWRAIGAGARGRRLRDLSREQQARSRPRRSPGRIEGLDSRAERAELPCGPGAEFLALRRIACHFEACPDMLGLRRKEAARPWNSIRYSCRGCSSPGWSPSIS
jgi:hypothetical protein